MMRVAIDHGIGIKSPPVPHIRFTETNHLLPVLQISIIKRGYINDMLGLLHPVIRHIQNMDATIINHRVVRLTSSWCGPSSQCQAGSITKFFSVIGLNVLPATFPKSTCLICFRSPCWPPTYICFCQMALCDCNRRVTWMLQCSDQERVFPNQYFDHDSVQISESLI